MRLGVTALCALAVAACSSGAAQRAAFVVGADAGQVATQSRAEAGAGGAAGAPVSTGGAASETDAARGSGGAIVAVAEAGSVGPDAATTAPDAGADASLGHDAGGVGTGGVSGTGGTQGTGGAIPIDPCAYPAGEHPIDCDGICGGTNGATYCATCRDLGGTGSGYFVFKQATDRACACDGASYRIPIASLYCARLTVEPGAHAGFTDQQCGKPAQDCLVINKDATGSPTAAFVYGPDRAAWIRFETVSQLSDDGKHTIPCPLICP